MLGLSTLCLVIACGGSGEAVEQEAGGAATDVAPLLAAAVTPVSSEANRLEFEFELPASRLTSAGIYTEDGMLVRTLWRGERRAAGRHLHAWDHWRDDGTEAAAGRYTVRLVHHDIRYVWQGVIGNSSARAGSVPYRGYYAPHALVADETHLHLGLGYNEAQSAIGGILLADPMQSSPRLRHVDPFVALDLLAGDATRMYAASTGGMSRRTFVMAFDKLSGRQTGFADGQALCLNPASPGRCHAAQSYTGIIALREPGEAVPTGLAVQAQGPVLAVAYGAEQRVRLFDKLSGQPLGEIALPLGLQSRQQLSMTPQGDLWVVLAASARRYTDLASGRPRLVAEISGLEQPLAAVADPLEPGALWLAEGGERQQLRRYAPSGVVTRTLGRAGALRSQAAVDDDTFCFHAGPRGEHTALAFEPLGAAPAGALWLVDTCNNRLLRLDADGRVLARAAYLPHVYAVSVDAATPSRVFANFLEFAVDHSKSDPSAPGAWRLVRNWLPGLPPSLRDAETANFGFGGFYNVQTLANGRTYGFIHVIAPGAPRAVPVMVELRADGRVAEVARGSLPSDIRTEPVLHDNGDLRWATDEGPWQIVWRRRLEGFAADGAPRWSALPEEMARGLRAATTPHHRMRTFAGLTGPRFPLTASGQVVFFDGSVDGGRGFHLGAVPLGGNSYAWQASPSGAMDGRGSFQNRGSDARIEYGGNVALTSGRSVMYGYHGEFYTDLANGRIGQANQFMHFLDNGLFLGQFGVPSTRDDVHDATTPGRSGNAFSPWLVRAGGRLYLLHNDESTWGGVHRWWINGIDDVVELSASGEAGSRLRLR